MLRMLGSTRRTCQGVTRRETLLAGGLSAVGGGLQLPQLLAAERSAESARTPARARNVMVLYLLGGAATQDMVDLKPDAPSGIRSEFRPIATTVPDLHVCEYLPGLAQWAHRMAIVRSVSHKGGCHNTLPSYTGFDEMLPDIGITKETYPPSMGSIVALTAAAQRGVPSYVYLPNYLGWGLAVRKPGPYGGFLGKRYDPLFSECTPYSDDGKGDVVYHPKVVRGVPVLPNGVLEKGMTLDRLDRRRDLLTQFDGQARAIGRAEDLGRFQQMAFDLLSASKVRDAFDLEQVEAGCRARYGNTLFGNSTLVGRRLIEAGVRFVNVTWDGYSARFQLNQEVWDTHARNVPILKEHLLPNFDAPFSALMEDLESSGLLAETLVVVLSEMGRTPKLNADGGRDHWTSCFSVMFAGAGVQGGATFGESDDHAAYVESNPVSAADVCATILEIVGIDPDMAVYDQNDRPVRAANGGAPIEAILA